MKIIIGLGNPGEKYVKTRHNIGFIVIDSIVQREDLVWKENKRLSAMTTRWNDTILVKPLTFMNNSGVAVQAVMAYYNLIPKKFKIFMKKDCDLSETLTVIHDDLDIDFGKVKESVDSRAAGNNGVQSIINHLKTKNLKRIRVGIKNEKLRKVIPVKNFVLMRFEKDEEEKLGAVIDNVIERIRK